MENTHNFNLYSPEHADGLKDLLGDTILPSMGMTLEGAAARDDLEELHFAEMRILSGSSVVGEYRFKRVKRIYECAVTGEGMPTEIYQHLLKKIEDSFPESKPLE